MSLYPPTHYLFPGTETSCEIYILKLSCNFQVHDIETSRQKNESIVQFTCTSQVGCCDTVFILYILYVGTKIADQVMLSIELFA